MAATDKVLVKLSDSVAAGNYYEAHQMYHSVCQRYMKQKKVSEALNLLQSGAKNLLKCGQAGSAADLFQRIIDIYVSSDIPVSDASISRLMDIFDEFPSEDPNCKSLIRNMIKWSTKYTDFPSGDPLLHHLIGLKFYRDQEYYLSESHFIHGTLESAKASGHMAFEWGSQINDVDIGYFLTRMVLMLLCLKKVHYAFVAIESFVKDLKSTSTSVTSMLPFNTDGNSSFELQIFEKSRLTNFCQYLIVCVQRASSVGFFQQIRSEFGKDLVFDPFLVEMVEKFGEIYYDLGVKRQPNVMQEMLKSLFAAPPAASSGQRSGITELD
ncbi:hypothetical protein HK098_005846 [Nowakowskiella sp. JEL0407]|nr:hypothetical protein HK098_005846 [Nowakowskiella sp. JEL0407]